MTKKVGLFLGPLLFAALLSFPAPAFLEGAAWRVLAMAVWMLAWWITEAVPLPVTALLPVLLLPLLGVMNMREAAAPYANPVVFLFMGGFMIGLAMERWSLHRRIALNIVRLTGARADGIILGFMLATAAMSMWISNTATTIMMLPIALSVVGLLQDRVGVRSEKGIRAFALSMMLGIAYAANIGGTATIIGTPPNVVFAGYMREVFDYEVGFARWMIVGLPLAAVLLALTYLIIVKLLYPNRLGEFEGAGELIRQEIRALGPLSTGEQRTLIVFIATALCWILRSNINRLLPNLELSDAGIALLATVALFVAPVDYRRGQFVLRWEDTEKLPWGILLLFGGGLSLASALAKTGIVDLIGTQFAGLGNAGFFIILGLTAVSLFLTEIISNVALVTIFLPVVGGIAQGAGISPFLICVPVTLAASFAFMLPMSTPPNAIVFASGHLTVPQMMRAGIILNILAILLVAFAGQEVIRWAFGG